MAWATFPTLTDGQVWTGAHTQIIRDNFAECPTAKATTAGASFSPTGVNTVAQRIPQAQPIVTSETTTSSSFTDLTTPGPTVTVASGTTALIVVQAHITTNTAGVAGRVGFVVSGATTVPGNNDNASCFEPTVAGQDWNGASVFLQTGLTSGNNTVKMVYKQDGGATGTFSSRYLSVLPF